MSRLRIEQRVDKFLFLSIISLILVLPQGIATSFASTFGHLVGYILIISMLLFSIKNNSWIIIRPLFSLIEVVGVWIVISIFNSIRLYREYGTLGGEDSFTAPLGSIFYHIFYLFLFLAYIRLVNCSNCFYDTLDQALNVIVWLQLITGSIQLIMILGVTSVSWIYDTINFLDILPESSFIISMSRIAMTGSEPASMASSLGVLSLPYLFTTYEDAAKRKKSIILFKIVWLLILAYFSKSSTVYMVVLVTLAFWIIRCAKKRKISKNVLSIIIVFFLIALILLLFFLATENQLSFDEGIGSELYYYLVVKPSDTSNMSTMHRLSTTVNDIAIITKHFLFGVGDGNQGFTYGENLPDYMLINPKTRDWANGIGGVVNGGAWFWAILSGYGLLGVFTLILWTVRYYIPLIHYKMNYEKELYNLFILAVPAIVITLLSGAMEPKIVFFLTIPFWHPKNE